MPTLMSFAVCLSFLLVDIEKRPPQEKWGAMCHQYLLLRVSEKRTSAGLSPSPLTAMSAASIPQQTFTLVQITHECFTVYGLLGFLSPLRHVRLVKLDTSQQIFFFSGWNQDPSVLDNGPPARRVRGSPAAGSKGKNIFSFVSSQSVTRSYDGVTPQDLSYERHPDS